MHTRHMQSQTNTLPLPYPAGNIVPIMPFSVSSTDITRIPHSRTVEETAKIITHQDGIWKPAFRVTGMTGLQLMHAYSIRQKKTWKQLSPGT